MKRDWFSIVFVIIQVAVILRAVWMLYDTCHGNVNFCAGR